LLRRALLSLVAIAVLSGGSVAASTGPTAIPTGFARASADTGRDPVPPAPVPAARVAALGLPAVLPATDPVSSPSPEPTVSAAPAATESANPAGARPQSSTSDPARPESVGPYLVPAPTPTPARPFPTGSTSAGGQLDGPIPPVTNLAPLPKCSYAELPTPLSSLADWNLTLADTAYALPVGYAPYDLVSAAPAGFYGGNVVRSVMLPDLTAMAAAAAKAGAPLALLSSYRAYDTQVYTFWHWVNELGYSQALLSSARPGHSEHQLGLAIDFKAAGGPDPWAYYDWARDTPAGAWLDANAWQFGFVMSYPKGKSPSVTCYGYEPWHYRYVGRAEAADIEASGLTTREWLWQRQPDQTPPPSTPPTYPVTWPPAVPSVQPSPAALPTTGRRRARRSTSRSPRP